MTFIKYVFSSLSSCALDLGLFALFCRLFRGRVIAYAALATMIARVISAIYNYCINYKIVFKSTERVSTSGVKYFALASVQMALSAALVTAGVFALPGIPETAVKLPVDTILFFISYMVQHKYIFLGSD